MSRIIWLRSQSLGVYTAATPASRRLGGVGLGDDPAHDHGHLAGAGLAQRLEHGGDQLGVRAGQDREADDVDALLGGRGGDLGGVSRMPS